MATTKKPAAKKSATKSTAKTSTKTAKTAAPKAETKQDSKQTATSAADKATKLAQDATAQAKQMFGQMNDQVEANVEDMADKFEAALTEVVKFGKQAGYTTVGVPFALQSKYEAGTLADVETYKTFLDDARYAGENQVAELQKVVEPYVKQAADRIDPLVQKWEDSLPENARKAVRQNRERVTRVVNA